MNPRDRAAPKAIPPIERPVADRVIRGQRGKRGQWPQAARWLAPTKINNGESRLIQNHLAGSIVAAMSGDIDQRPDGTGRLAFLGPRAKQARTGAEHYPSS